jgi:hypothetical protein
MTREQELRVALRAAADTCMEIAENFFKDFEPAKKELMSAATTCEKAASYLERRQKGKRRL